MLFSSYFKLFLVASSVLGNLVLFDGINWHLDYCIYGIQLRCTVEINV